MNKKNITIILVVLLVIFIGIITIKSIKKKQEVINVTEVQIVKPTIEDVVNRIKSAETTQVDTTGWKEYNSPKLGIKFKYPATLITSEWKDAVGLYEDTIENRYYIDNINKLNSEAGPINVIVISNVAMPREGYSVTNIVEDYNSNLVAQKLSIFSYDAVAYTFFVQDYFDGVKLIRNNRLFNFQVTYSLDPSEQTREDYYKILSTLEFLK